MLTLKYIQDGEQVVFHYEDKDKKMVRELYAHHVALETEGLECIDENGMVYRPAKKAADKVFAIEVFFVEDGRTNKHVYTYGCKRAMKAGDKALVSTLGGLKVVQVISSTQIEKTALQGLCKGKKPQYIIGAVTLY